MESIQWGLSGGIMTLFGADVVTVLQREIGDVRYEKKGRGGAVSAMNWVLFDYMVSRNRKDQSKQLCRYIPSNQTLRLFLLSILH